MKTKTRIIAVTGALFAFSFATLFAQEPVGAPPAPEPAPAVETQARPVPPMIADPAPEPKTEIIAITTDTTSGTATLAGQKPDKRPAANSSERGRRNRAEMVSFGSDIHVTAGQSSRSAVAICGNVLIDGDAYEAVAILGSVTANTKLSEAVSIVGSTTVNGGAREAVAVVGNVYVNSHVTGDVVAVCGGVELGPDARVDGEVVALGGGLKRAETASVGGKIVQFKLFGGTAGFGAWVSKALGQGRLLAIGPGLAWAWIVAGIFLLLYVITAMLFPKAVVKCAETLEIHPGYALLAALLTVIIKPILAIVLAVTIIGPLVFVPISIALAIMGKTAFLAWLGRRVTLKLGSANAALAVLLGGVLLALLYCVPILGIMLWKFAGFIGTGAVVYAAILALRRKRTEREAARAAEKATRDAANPPPSENAIITASDAAALAPRAGFWIRTGALLIDALLVFTIVALCHIAKIIALAFFIYCALMWALRGTTVGGIICGLKIVRLDGRPMDWSTAIFRALFGFLSVVPAGLGFIWVAFDTERQSWHDKAAGTIVVYAPKGQSLI